MGFSTIMTSVLMFIVLMFVFINIFSLNRHYLENTNSISNSQNERLSDVRLTKIDIQSVEHISAQNVTSINISNDGQSKLDPEYISIYIDKERVTNNHNNLSIEFSYDVINPNMWDPGEIIRVNVTKNLTSADHMVDVFTENGISSSKVLSTGMWS